MRIQVNLSDDMVMRVDDYAKQFGVTRSALCSMLIGQGVLNFDNTKSVIDSLGSKFAETIIANAPKDN